MDRIHHDQTTREQLGLDLDENARQGAKEMLASALQAEVQAYLKGPKPSAMKKGGFWSSRTVMPRVGRSCAGPARSR